MTTAVATPRLPAKAPRPRAEEVSRSRQPRATTLEAAIAGAWEDLLGRGRAECLVCGGDLRRAGRDGAECGRCGSTLS